MDPDPLAGFSTLARTWFEGAFERPTAAQVGAWSAIASGEDALVVAPTGSGKTLAAFLWALDRMASSPVPPKDQRLRVVYVSPLKALAVDIDRNLRAPLAGMRQVAAATGHPAPDIVTAIRTGDTPAEDRRRFGRQPPDILITTPESLYLLLTSAAREALRNVETVIVDEVHAVAGTKRGAHLALTLERLDELLERPAQRVGLSATVRPHLEVARFIGGPNRDVSIVAPPSPKAFDIRIVVPVEDMTAPGAVAVDAEGRPDFDATPQERSSVWPAVEERIVDLIQANRSTIVFANSRRLAERLCARLNEIAHERRTGEPMPAGTRSPAEYIAQGGTGQGAPMEIARAHHGSVSKEQRGLIEEELKSGRLPAVVATSSLELGIDMGAVDLVIQVESPPSVASGLQRIGRGGHHVGAISRGVVFPKFRGDLVESAVVVERMRTGQIEEIRYPRNPLDVLAQQIVAMVAVDDWTVDDLAAVVRRAAPFADLPDSALHGVLDMLAGRYPSDEFSELRPRVNWDRTTGRITTRGGAQWLAVTSGGTIPDRGLFGVFLAGERAARVGELDEEMVYESRVGDTFVLGATTWRIEDITRDRVLVTPAPGQPGRMPFWLGDAPGRPVELGRAVGATVRELEDLDNGGRRARLSAAGLDHNAIENLLAYIDEQRAATGILPDDRTIVLERFRDEIGDWRVCIHTPFGAPVHAPWAQAIESRVSERLGLEVQTMYSDDGIVVRLPEADEAPPADSVLFSPEEVEDLVLAGVGSSALFAGRFREAAARALLLPRRRPDRRTPLWQQRQRSATLQQVASKYPAFPIVLETYRECLQDVFDLPALVELMAAVQRRQIRVVEVDTATPSPFASSLLFGYVAAFMYEGDAPLAERRAQVLSLDRAVLAELLGREQLRDLVDGASLEVLELELQLLTEDRGIASADGLHDALRRLGDLSEGEIRSRSASDAAVQGWLAELAASRRAMEVRIAGQSRWAAMEDAARLRDALGTALPVGVPGPFLEPVADAVGDLVARYGRTHGPFTAGPVGERLGLGVAVVEQTLRRLESQGRAVEGEFRPDGTGREWIDAEVLRRLRTRSLAQYRREVEPAPPVALSRFLAAWQGLGPAGPRRADPEAVYRAIEQLQGAPVPASALERLVLPSRLPGYVPAMLDQLCASGEVMWAGAGAVGADDGWICLFTADSMPTLIREPAIADLSPAARSVRDALANRGAMFFRQIGDALEGHAGDAEVVLALWELVWAGVVTNDTLNPLRAVVSGAARRRAPRLGRRPRRPAHLSRTGPPAGAGRWSLLRPAPAEPTRRLHVLAEQLLDRYGIVTRGTVAAERVSGGFAAAYAMLKALEEAGRCRRGYFVEGLGGAQFAAPGAVDRMRGMVEPSPNPLTLVLAASDPVNPYGSALPWPERDAERPGHRPGRKIGAVVVLVDGELIVYVEKGGRTLLTYTEDPDRLGPAIDALALSVRDGALGRLDVERADGEAVFDTPLARALTDAGFRPSPKGLRLRA
jgi:ATP-dependent Lhr-like helicase